MKKLLLFVGMACASTVYAKDDLVIALAGPSTGAVSQYGTLQAYGALAAIERINAEGGVNGHTLVAKHYDDACEPRQAVSVANQIINDGVQFVIGHLCSSSTMPAAEIYDEEGVLMITAASTDPALSQKGYETIFRTIGTDAQSAPTSANYIAEVLKPKKIALLHDKQQYGQGLAEGVRDSLRARGIEVDFFEGVTQGQTDFSALITKLKNAGVDFVYWGGFHPEIGLIIRQGADQGFTPQYMGADGVDNPDLFAIAGEAASGILATVPKNFASDPRNTDLVAFFNEKGQDPTLPFILNSYAAVSVIAQAATHLGSEDPYEIAEFLRSGEVFATPIGDISFSENGDLKDFQSVIYALGADGSRELKTF